MRRVLAALLLVALVGCDAKEPEPAPARFTAGNVVLRVRTEGRFTGYADGVVMPELVLYGDGRLVTRGTAFVSGRGPALQDARYRRLDQKAVERVLAAAREAGVDGDRRDYGEGDPGMGWDVFELTDSEGSATTRVHHLDGGAGLTKEQRERRERLRDLKRRLLDLGWLGSGAGVEGPYPTKALLVFAEADAARGPARTWRGADPSQGVRVGNHTCTVVAGAALDPVTADLSAATLATSWLHGGRRYRLVARPMLPDERGCAVA